MSCDLSFGKVTSPQKQYMYLSQRAHDSPPDAPRTANPSPNYVQARLIEQASLTALKYVRASDNNSHDADHEDDGH